MFHLVLVPSNKYMAKKSGPSKPARPGTFLHTNHVSMVWTVPLDQAPLRADAFHQAIEEDGEQVDVIQTFRLHLERKKTQM